MSLDTCCWTQVAKALTAVVGQDKDPFNSTSVDVHVTAFTKSCGPPRNAKSFISDHPLVTSTLFPRPAV